MTNGKYEERRLTESSLIPGKKTAFSQPSLFSFGHSSYVGTLNNLSNLKPHNQFWLTLPLLSDMNVSLNEEKYNNKA